MPSRNDHPGMRKIFNYSRLLIFLHVVLLINDCCCFKITALFQTPPDDDSTFSDDSINLITSDPLHDKIYVGARNNIFVLDSNLKQISNLSIGPLLDNQECYFDAWPLSNSRNCTSDTGVTLSATETTDNIVLALLATIDSTGQKQLIACGTYRHGLCEYYTVSDDYTIRPLGNSSSKVSISDRFSVSNDSTVLYVGPGPENGRLSLWMGAYKRVNKVDRYHFFSNLLGVSVRTIKDSSREEDVQKSVKAYINTKAAFSCDYRAEYVAAFGSDGFTYFMARMPLAFSPKGYLTSTSCLSDKTLSSSKIVQVCQSDQTLKSYVETAISCRSGKFEWSVLKSAVLVKPGKLLVDSYSKSKLRNETNMNIGLNESFIVGVFGYDDSYGNSTASRRSHALCFYPISWIRKMMLTNLRKCFTESLGDIGPQFPDPKKCETVYQNIGESYCRADGCDYLHGPLSGSVPITAASSLLVNINSDITSMTSTVVDIHTILFLGTNSGELVKVVVDSFDGGDVKTAYKSAEISSRDNTPVQKDLLLSPDSRFLFAATRRKVYKIPVSECEMFLTCQDCLSADDPLCGWCSLEGRCSLKSECLSVGFRNAWLSRLESRDDVCPAYNSVTSHHLNLDAGEDSIQFNISNFPSVGDKNSFFKCSFKVYPPVKIADVNATYPTLDRLACNIIDLKRSLPYMSGEIKLTVKLFAVDRGTSRDSFLFIDYQLFRCSTLKNCSKCIEPEGGTHGLCGWCFYSNECVSLKNNTNPCSSSSLFTDVHLCPRLRNQKEKMLAAGSNQTIELEAENLPEFGKISKYFCQFGDDPQDVQATYVNNSKVLCHPSQISRTDREPKIVPLQLFWEVSDGNSWFPIENSVNVAIFNCSSMSENDDCSICRSLSYGIWQKFGCTWCGHECSHSCKRKVHSECPGPSIVTVRPQSGPMHGGTSLTVIGSNLGSRLNETNILIGGIPCNITSRSVSKNLTCTTARSTKASKNLPVLLKVGKNTALNISTFSYTNPKFYSITPSHGPMYGGTLVTIVGEELNFSDGQDLLVAIGSPCLIDRHDSNASAIICKTTRFVSTTATETTVSLKIDSAEVTSENVKFKYRPDPNVLGIHPTSTYKSGGCPISVAGLNLDSASVPVMKMASRFEFQAQPSFMNSTFLVFPYPAADAAETFDQSQTEKLTFVFDGLHVSKTLEITPDPEIILHHLSQNQFLDIQGKNFLNGCSSSHVRVTVGQEACEVVEFTNTNIICLFPSNASSSSSDKLQINVSIGSMHVNVGPLQWFGPRPKNPPPNNMLVIIIGSVVSSVVVLLFVIGVVVVSRKISIGQKKNNILLNRIQDLEKSVSRECKHSFAELQTHVTGFSSEISDVGIPYWDFQTYAFKFLFPMLKDHHVLRKAKDEISDENHLSGNEKLNQLYQLLSNKHFLITFIKAMENQPKEFGIEDRSRLASWLTVIFINKLDYATMIMKCLLEELIKKSIEKNGHKMTLRRTESVVEKLLSNWLGLTMFHYMRNEVGKCLFMLCKAIEYQVEDGPVDAISLESKFSLAEDRLLRVKVDPQILNVTVLGSEVSHMGPIACKLLDCDTISQAKHKAMKALYKNDPYSTIPLAKDFELRLRMAGHENGLLLRDEDSSTLRKNEWVQLNTLKHFNIKSGSTFLLLYHRSSHSDANNCNTWESHGKVMMDSGSSLGTLKLSDTKYEAKYFHLVKHDEMQNYYEGSEKVVSEVFLPRLLITKKALEEYISQLFRSMMSCDRNFPPSIKFLYDFFDATAQKFNITDPDVVHIWKSNSLPLRFWVNVLRNPDFVFDTEKSSLVDPCLAVIAQIFIDGCSTHKQQLGFDSSSAKLLFAKEMHSYKSQVDNFYTSVQRMPPVDSDSMTEFFSSVEKEAENKFNIEVALHEVYKYAIKFHVEVQKSLEEDSSCSNLKLPFKFHHMCS